MTRSPDGEAGETEDPPDRLAALAAQTLAVYERNATRFDRERSRHLHERAWLERFVADLPTGAPLLDLGCGAGEPIATWLRDRGFAVTGLDGAPAMLALARARAPEGDWRQGDMRTLELADRFAGIVAWDSFFHLTAAEQRACLPRLARHLRPGGRLMATVGPAAGAVTGRVGDEMVHHASLDPSDYGAILRANGLRLLRFVVEDPACGRRTVLLAERGAG